MSDYPGDQRFADEQDAKRRESGATPRPAQGETARQIAERIIRQIEAKWSVAYLRGYIEEAIAREFASLTADLAQARQEVDKLNDLIFADDVTNRLLRPPDPLSDDEANALLQTTDGTEWAAMFCRATGFPDVAWALTWFCNAIMAGHDHVVRTTLAAAEQARDEALKDLEQHKRLCLAEGQPDGVWPCGCLIEIIDSHGSRKLIGESCDQHDSAARTALLEAAEDCPWDEQFAKWLRARADKEIPRG